MLSARFLSETEPRGHGGGQPGAGRPTSSSWTKSGSFSSPAPAASSSSEEDSKSAASSACSSASPTLILWSSTFSSCAPAGSTGVPPARQPPKRTANGERVSYRWPLTRLSFH